MLWFQSGLKCWTDGHTYPYSHVAKNHKKIQYIQAIYMEAKRCQRVMPSWHPTRPWPSLKPAYGGLHCSVKFTLKGACFMIFLFHVCRCANLAGEQTQWNRPALSIPPIPACEYDVFMAKLPSVIRTRLSIIRTVEGVQLKRNLSVALLTRGWISVILVAFISTFLSLASVFSLSLCPPVS